MKKLLILVMLIPMYGSCQSIVRNITAKKDDSSKLYMYVENILEINNSMYWFTDSITDSFGNTLQKNDSIHYIWKQERFGLRELLKFYRNGQIFYDEILQITTPIEIKVKSITSDSIQRKKLTEELYIELRGKNEISIESINAQITSMEYTFFTDNKLVGSNYRVSGSPNFKTYVIPMLSKHPEINKISVYCQIALNGQILRTGKTFSIY